MLKRAALDDEIDGKRSKKEGLEHSDEFKLYQQLLINAKLSQYLEKLVEESKNKIQQRVQLIGHQNDRKLREKLSLETQKLSEKVSEIKHLIEPLRKLSNIYSKVHQPLSVLSFKLGLLEHCAISPVNNWELCQQHLNEISEILEKKQKLLSNISYISENLKAIEESFSKLQILANQCQRMNDSYSNLMLLRS